MKKGTGMGKAAYGKMEKALGKKDVEKGMKEGSKKDVKKDMALMIGIKMGKAPMKKGGKK